MEIDGVQKLYFVVETKGTNRMSELPKNQADKIRCGKKHFEALKTGITLELANTMEDLEDNQKILF